MGRSRATHAGVAQTEKQDRLVRLIAQGMTNSEACRQVGINRRTGTRWRFGRKIQNTAGVDVHDAPARSATPSTRHPRYLSLAERTVIADLRRLRWTVRRIAEELDRSPSKVSRELRRNADHRGRYLPASADKAAVERITRPRARRVAVDVELQAVVVELLDRRWSPEQVTTSCPTDSLTSPTGSSSPSRSIRRAMTPTCRSPARKAPAPAPQATGAGPRATRSADRDDHDR